MPPRSKEEDREVEWSRDKTESSESPEERDDGKSASARPSVTEAAPEPEQVDKHDRPDKGDRD